MVIIMKEILFATYKGEVYSAGTTSDDKIVLKTTDAQKVKLGFEKEQLRTKILYQKIVLEHEVENIFEKRMYAKYKGHLFSVIDEKDNDKILITNIKGDYHLFESIGMEKIDNYSYEKWIPKSEALIKEEIEYIKNISHT